MITKHGVSLWSTDPPERAASSPTTCRDEAAAATAALDLADDYRGGDGGRRLHGRPRARRAVSAPRRRHHARRGRVAARCDDRGIAAAMAADEWVGRDVRVDGTTFSA